MNKTSQTTESTMLIDGLSIDDFIKKETQTREVEFWGQKHTITPALVDKIHGDGLQVVWLSSINTRPFYYVLRIDSSIELDDDESLNKKDKANYGTVCEMMLRMIEEEYDNIDRYEQMEDGKYYDSCDSDVEPFEYTTPMLSWGGGSWGLIANFKTGEVDT